MIDKNGIDNVYEYEFSNTKDFLIPSATKRKQMLAKALMEPSVVDEIAKMNGLKSENLTKVLSGLSEDDKAKYAAQGLGQCQPLMAAYGKRVVENGFNATIDDNGRCVGEMPVIAFLSNSSLNVEKIQRVDNIISMAAMTKYNANDAREYRKLTATAY